MHTIRAEDTVDDASADRIPFEKDMVAEGIRDAAGLPQAVMFVGPPHREEVVISAMAEIERSVKRKFDFPFRPLSSARL